MTADHREAAVQAAAEAIHWTPLSPDFDRRDPAYTPPEPSEWEVRAGRTSVAAAEPHIRADERARIAAATLAMAEQFVADSRDERKTRDHRFGLAASATTLKQWAARIAEDGAP